MVTNVKSLLIAPVATERRDLPIGLIVPFFSNGLLDESDSDVKDDHYDDNDDDIFTISAFGDVSLSEAYTIEQSTSAESSFRKPRLKVLRPKFHRGRGSSGKEIFSHEGFLKSLRTVTSRPPSSPTSDFQILFNTMRSSRDLLMTTHPSFGKFGVAVPPQGESKNGPV